MRGIPDLNTQMCRGPMRKFYVILLAGILAVWYLSFRLKVNPKPLATISRKHHHENVTLTKQTIQQSLACDLEALPEKNWRDYMTCAQGSGCKSPGNGSATRTQQAAILCREAFLPAVKVIRVELLEHLADFLAQNVFILHLVRDPRSIMRSWKEFGQAGKPRNEISRYCDDVKNDLAFVRSLRGTPLSQFHYLIRYEDLVYEPGYYIGSIYDAIGIPLITEVHAWIKDIYKHKYTNNTQFEEKMVSSFRNDPDKVPNKWREELSMEDVEYIQDVCADMMADLGYIPVDKRTKRKASINVVDYTRKFSYFSWNRQ